MMEVPRNGTSQAGGLCTSAAGAELDLPDQTTMRPVSLESDKQIELTIALEELAELIETEGGLLIP
jgi:hypothetical protein